MQVLTNILKQGTEFAVLSESAMEDRYEKLVDLIASPDLTLVLSLCNVCPVSEIDDLAIVLLHVFESRGLAMPLLKAIIMKEVRETGKKRYTRARRSGCYFYPETSKQFQGREFNLSLSLSLYHYQS